MGFAKERYHMEKRSVKEWVIRAVLLMIGLTIAHGRTHMAISLIIIFVLLFVDRTYIKIGTVLCMVCGGPIIDFFTWVFGLFLPEQVHIQDLFRFKRDKNLCF